MHVVYLCNFNLKNVVGGKDRATKQKIEALRRQSRRFKAYHLSKDGELYNVIISLWLDLCCGFYIIFNKPDFFISRGTVGYFSLLMAKVVGTVSAREVHAVSGNELHLLPFGKIKKFLLKHYFRLFGNLDCLADVLIFNHPFLLEHYKGINKGKPYDFFCYNGYDPSSICSDSSMDVYKKFGLERNKKYLSFTGSVSRWHGVDCLVSLQECFNENGDNIQIIIAGGNAATYDPGGLCINITPLNEVGCGEIISISSLCLLPVKDNRVSPGSPLKLYDYIGHKKQIVAEDIMGYSDEVDKYGVGISVEFENTEDTRNKIVAYLEELNGINEGYPQVPVTWDDRIRYWLMNLAKLKR